MARRLPQPQQRFEDLKLPALQRGRVCIREKRSPVMIAQLVVQRALRFLELAVQRLFELRRQLRRDLLFRAPQDERPQAAREQRDALFVERAHAAEHRAPEETRVEEVEEAAKLAEMVFDRCSTERDPEAG